jgi:hypothetical protein
MSEWHLTWETACEKHLTPTETARDCGEISRATGEVLA